MYFIIMLFCLICLAACQPAAPTGQSPDPDEGIVTITSPMAGNTLYSEVLHITGTAQAALTQIQITVTSAEGITIASGTATVSQDGQWLLELPHYYTDSPTEISIQVRATDETAPPYAETSAILAGLTYRPAGIYGAIHTPASSVTVGGDQIPITGIVSGLNASSLILSLQTAEGATLDEQTILITPANALDETGWTGALQPQNHIGPATVTIATPTGEIIASIAINLDQAAG